MLANNGKPEISDIKKSEKNMPESKIRSVKKIVNEIGGVANHIDESKFNVDNEIVASDPKRSYDEEIFLRKFWRVKCFNAPRTVDIDKQTESLNLLFELGKITKKKTCLDKNKIRIR